MYRSPADHLNEAIGQAHKAYKTLAREILGVSDAELEQLIAGALVTVSASAAAGWEIGQMIGGAETAAIGAAVGCTVGVIVVVGAIAYRVWIKKPSLRSPVGTATVWTERLT